MIRGLLVTGHFPEVFSFFLWHCHDISIWCSGLGSGGKALVRKRGDAGSTPAARDDRRYIRVYVGYILRSLEREKL
jgi:hypothetical protein